MRRPIVSTAFAMAALLFGAPMAAAQTAASTSSTPSAPPTPPAKAWIAVDADTGAVIDASNDRTPLPPASLSKMFTALAAIAFLDPNEPIEVSANTAAAPPNKLNMLAGESWTRHDTLNALLLSSANDAAAAIGEAVSGSLEAFPAQMRELAERIGLEDNPVLWDPAGLDDSSSVAGGNLVSARDLAITARSLLREPELAEIVASRQYRFVDPGGEPHVLGNHNKLLHRYPGAMGLKTGYTRRSGHCLASVARRDGRTALTVVIGASDMYGLSASLLDRVFASPASGASTDLLPPVRSVRNDVAEPGEVVVPLNAQRVAERSGWALQPLTTGWPGRMAIATAMSLVGLRIRARRRMRRRRAQRYAI